MSKKSFIRNISNKHHIVKEIIFEQITTENLYNLFQIIDTPFKGGTGSYANKYVIISSMLHDLDLVSEKMIQHKFPFLYVESFGKGVKDNYYIIYKNGIPCVCLTNEDKEIYINQLNTMIHQLELFNIV